MRHGVEWVQHWKSQPGAPWDVRQFINQDGTHSASIGKGYRDAMVWLFKE